MESTLTKDGKSKCEIKICASSAILAMVNYTLYGEANKVMLN